MSRTVRSETVCPADDPLTGFFDVSRDLLCIRDLRGGLVRVNPAWEGALGYAVSELTGANLLDLVHPEDVAATQATMREVEAGSGALDFVNRYRTRAGDYRHLEWRAARRGDLVFGVARDITTRVADEAALRRAKQEAEAAAQARTDFLSDVSHEIRTPLNGVIGMLDALARTALDDEQRAMVRVVERSGATLQALVGDLLDMAKIDAGRLDLERRPFNLRAELDPVMALHRVAAHAKGVDVVVAYGEGAGGEFEGDAVRLRQVLGNLLSNAVKFTPRGAITVRIAVGPAPCADEALSVEVEDTGIGFGAETDAGLFARFSQARGAGSGGTGLGLAISRSLVERMEGAICARSEPGVGSVFRFTVPLPRVAVAAASAAPADAVGRALGLAPGARVLVAEDHLVNRAVLTLLLEPLGVEVVATGDGAAAVEAFAASQFALVLMDVHMPVMDGLTAIGRIRALEAGRQGAGRGAHQDARPARTPIAVLSADAMPQHRAAAAAAGADGHIAKPITAASLLNGIAETLAACAALPLPDRAAA